VAYVADLLNAVDIIDEARQKETRQITGFAGPYALGVNPNTGKVYVWFNAADQQLC
jgi:DNA-binding beta-propeller fold protein YncE